MLFYTRQSLCRVYTRQIFYRQKVLCRVLFSDTRQRFCRVSKALGKLRIEKTRQKEFFRRVFSFTEGFLRGTRQRAKFWQYMNLMVYYIS
jgi:hypothetical protein